MANRGVLECKVFVGNLGNQGCKIELQRVFSYYGRLKNVWVARDPPGFAFVEFKDFREAEHAAYALDGTLSIFWSKPDVPDGIESAPIAETRAVIKQITNTAVSIKPQFQSFIHPRQSQKAAKTHKKKNKEKLAVLSLRTICGVSAQVEMSSGMSRSGTRFGGSSGGRGGGGRHEDRDEGRSRRLPYNRSRSRSRSPYGSKERERSNSPRRDRSNSGNPAGRNGRRHHSRSSRRSRY